MAMNKLILLLAAAAIAAPLAAPHPARADDAEASAATTGLPPQVRALFGNTLFTIEKDGRSRKLWFSPDGTWTGLSRRGLDLAGKWKMDGDKVCMSQSKPGLPGSLCQTFPADLKVGVESKTPAKGGVRLKLVKGRVTG